MAQDGTRSYELAQIGITEAENIIIWVEKCLAKNKKE